MNVLITVKAATGDSKVTYTISSENNITAFASEESKVKLWHRVSLISDLKKRGASRVAHFLHSIFKEQAPPQSGEGSLLRWFWSFTGASRAVAARTGAAIIVVPQPA